MRLKSFLGFATMALCVLNSIPATAGSPESMKFVSPSVLQRVEDDSNLALERLKKQVPTARKMLDSAAGVLVIPRMRSDGAIIGVAYGSGVLRETEGRHTYYNAVVGPSTAYASLDGKTVILIFARQREVLGFRSGLSWTDGINGTLSLLDSTTDERRSEPASEYIVAVILGSNGVAPGLALTGIQFIKVPMYMCGTAAANAPDRGETPC